MTTVSIAIPIELLAAYSRADLTRREIAERMGEPVGFGRLLGELHRAGLPLPRIASDPEAPGVQIVRDVTARAMARAG